jgi:hypothetical protein
MEVVISAKLLDNVFAHSSTLHCWDLASLQAWRLLAMKVGTSKGGGKAMATYP